MKSHNSGSFEWLAVALFILLRFMEDGILQGVFVIKIPPVLGRNTFVVLSCTTPSFNMLYEIVCILEVGGLLCIYYPFKRSVNIYLYRLLQSEQLNLYTPLNSEKLQWCQHLPGFSWKQVTGDNIYLYRYTC